MQWAVSHIKLQFFLRLDEDGYLCVDSLMQELPHLIDRHFISGRFHCDPGKTRTDENFMLISRNSEEYFLQGWVNSRLPFDGATMLALNICSQIVRLWREEGWTFRGDQLRPRWVEPFDIEDVCRQ